MKIKVTRTVSYIGTKQNVRETIKSLKLNRINSSAIVETDNLCALGRVNLIRHLVKIEEI